VLFKRREGAGIPPAVGGERRGERREEVRSRVNAVGEQRGRDARGDRPSPGREEIELDGAGWFPG